MRKWLSFAMVAVLAAGCDSDRMPLGPDPSYLIEDGANNNGNIHFYWLPPIAPPVPYPGIFDPTAEPVVQICEFSEDKCVLPLIAEFTKTSGTGGDTITMSAVDELYQVAWHANQFDLDTQKIYRIQTVLSGEVLGFADVMVVNNGQGLKDVNRDLYIPLNDNRTLQIKFRIETGAVSKRLVFYDDFSGDLSHWVSYGGGTATINDADELIFDYNIGCGSITCPQADLLLVDDLQPGAANWRVEVQSGLIVAYTGYLGGAIGNGTSFALFVSQSEKEQIIAGMGWQGLVAPLTSDVIYTDHQAYPWYRVGSGTVTVPQWYPAEWQTVALEKIGDTYRLYFNEQEVYSVTRTFSAPPKVGLHTYGQKRFDDFKLYILP